MTQNQQINPEEGVNALETYGHNLTQLAKEGKIDPVIGREDEIRRIVQILSRRNKNNPVLTNRVIHIVRTRAKLPPNKGVCL